MSYPHLFTTFGLGGIAREIDEERARQDTKFGEQNHRDGTGSKEQQSAAESARKWCDDAFASGYGTWSDVLAEEVAEANAERDPAKLRAELLHVAAVAVAWIQAIDRRTSNGRPSESADDRRRAALADAIQRAGGEWTAIDAGRAYRRAGLDVPNRATWRADLKHLARAGFLTCHDAAGRRYYTRKDDAR